MGHNALRRSGPESRIRETRSSGLMRGGWESRGDDNCGLQPPLFPIRLLYLNAASSAETPGLVLGEVSHCHLLTCHFNRVAPERRSREFRWAQIAWSTRNLWSIRPRDSGPAPQIKRHWLAGPGESAEPLRWDESLTKCYLYGDKQTVHHLRRRPFSKARVLRKAPVLVRNKLPLSYDRVVPFLPWWMDLAVLDVLFLRGARGNGSRF